MEKGVKIKPIKTRNSLCKIYQSYGKEVLEVGNGKGLKGGIESANNTSFKI